MRKMFSEKQIQKLAEDYIKENGLNWDIEFKSITTKIINVLSQDGESYCPIDYDYQDADDHRLVILDNVQVSGDLNSSGDIKANTLEQSEPNYSIDLSEVELVVSTAGCTAQNIFSRIQVINKELEIIFTFSITNTTER